MSSSLLRAVSTAAVLASSVAAQQFVMYTPGGDDTVVERIDPILSPGGIAQHVHQVFGANGLSPDMTYDSLQSSTCTTVGAANGHGNAADHSVYWHPALYMEAKNGTGFLRIPTNGHKLYYKDAGSKKDVKADPFEFPKGFRMVAGDALMRAAASDAQRQNITQWICHSDSKPNQGTSGGFPNGVSDCGAYPGFNGAIHFPHCWNGDSFNPAAPFAHVVYPDGDIQNGICPSTHPTRLPHIFMENQFDLHSMVDQVKPNTFTLAQGDPTGYGWHADFYNGWEEGAIPSLFDECPQGSYGNEDVGSCSNMKQGSKTDECHLTNTYIEKVNNPGQFLPGCNPVQTVNPALKFLTAALGIITDSCSSGSSSGGSGSGGSGGSGSSSSTSSSSAPASSSSTPIASSASSSHSKKSSFTTSTTSLAKSSTSTSRSSTTFATSTSTTKQGHKHSSHSTTSSAVNKAVTAAPIANIVTEFVTDIEYVTVFQTIQARDAHAHARAHARRHRL